MSIQNRTGKNDNKLIVWAVRLSPWLPSCHFRLAIRSKSKTKSFWRIPLENIQEPIIQTWKEHARRQFKHSQRIGLFPTFVESTPTLTSRTNHCPKTNSNLITETNAKMKIGLQKLWRLLLSCVTMQAKFWPLQIKNHFYPLSLTLIQFQENCEYGLGLQVKFWRYIGINGICNSLCHRYNYEIWRQTLQQKLTNQWFLKWKILFLFLIK